MYSFDKIFFPQSTDKITRVRRSLTIFLILFLALLIITGFIISEKFIGVLGLVTFLVFGLLQTEKFLLSLFAIRPVIDQFAWLPLFEVGPLIMNMGTILGGGIIFVAMGFTLLRKVSFFRFRFVLPLSLFLLVNAMSVLLSNNFLLGLNDWFRICSWIIVFIWIVGVFDTEKKIDKLINVCVLAAIITVFIFFLQWALGHAYTTYGEDIGQRVGWFMGGNAAGLVLLGTFPFVLFRAFQVQGIKQVFYIGLIIAVAACVFFTFFRTNWIVFLIQITVIIFLKRQQIKRSFLILSIAFVTLSYLVTTERYAVEERLEDFYYLEESNPLVHRRVGSGRYGIWQDNIDAFVQAPIFTKMLGQGMRGSALVTGGWDAHNDFLSILSNNGLIGLFVYLWFLFTLFKTGRALSRTATSAYHQNIACLFWIVFISWLARAVLTGTIFSPNGMWYIAAAIGITNTALTIQNNKQNNLDKSVEA